MGVHNLNKFISEKCKKIIKSIKMDCLSNKTIVVDISIYLYKFDSMESGSLFENIYLMLSVFKYYNIQPIFIFDGKSGTIKSKTLEKRKKIKHNNINKLDNLSYIYENIDKKSDEGIKISKDLNKLKKKIVWMTKDKINKVKRLIQYFEYSYFESPEESDGYCVQMVNNGKAWGCLSDDTDMFVYGCKRVLRNFNMINHSIELYDMNLILNELNINQDNFLKVCILSGTDYTDKIFNINKSFELFNEYIRSNSDEDFYIWLLKNDVCIDSAVKNGYEHYKSINCFTLIGNNTKLNNDVDINTLIYEEGFIFI